MKRRLLLILISLVAVGTALAISPNELQAKLDSGSKLTIVDVRNLGLFEKGHIPGAINIPAVFCPEKKLPPLGEVVVYDSGLGRDEATSAAAALNAKPGISAKVLEGGFAAWQQVRGDSTQGRGMREQEIPMISYADLQSAQSNAVLIDLRKPVVQTRQDASNSSPPPPLTDLRTEFPAAAVAKSPFNLPQTRQSGSGSTAPPLLVLIDSGDGAAQRMAATLKANGMNRFVILAGGESILARHGQPGMQRTTMTTLPVGTPPDNTNK